LPFREERSIRGALRLASLATAVGCSYNCTVSAKPRPAPKHIFCIEGNWDSSLAQQTTVRPVLELLEVNAGVKYIYRDCSTRTELDFLLDKWRQKGYGEYKILYLAFHGEPGRIIIDSRNTVTLDELAERMPCRTSRRLIYFGA